MTRIASFAALLMAACLTPGCKTAAPPIADRDRALIARIDSSLQRAASYMATRYLQLQHPGRLGMTSGDGRSIWNGRIRHRGTTWDVSSCGTGVTRLCPATAETQLFFPTGNARTDYGCGTAALAEGINAALMSEVFHRNGIATERVLAVLALPSGLAINVRAAPRLLASNTF